MHGTYKKIHKVSEARRHMDKTNNVNMVGIFACIM